jgi:hypothetical protein
MTNAPDRGGAGTRTAIALDGNSRVPQQPPTKQPVQKVGNHELDPLLRRARRAGWYVERLGSGHLRWVSPGNDVVVTSSTPRSAIAALTALRKAGL